MSDFIPTWNKNITTFKHNSIIPNSFRMLIIGPSNCGKTVLLLKMLITPNFLDYNNLIIFSKTIDQPEFQIIYHGFNSGLSKQHIVDIFMNQDKIPDDLSIQDICENFAELYPNNSETRSNPLDKISVTMSNKYHEIIPCDKLDKNKKNLVVFDDCVNLKNQEIMESYFTRGRHNKCNAIYLAQNYYDLPGRSIRGNSNFFIFFQLNKRNKDNIYNDLFSNLLEKIEFNNFDNHLVIKHNYIALAKEHNRVYEKLL